MPRDISNKLVRFKRTKAYWAFDESIGDISKAPCITEGITQLLSSVTCIVVLVYLFNK